MTSNTSDDASKPAPPSRGPTRPAGRAASPPIDIRDLVGEGREVAILHGGEIYRLRITARDRLILTK